MASDGFIREVDEELQRDRMTQLWKRYGTIAVGVVLVVILAAAGKVGWDAWQARQLEQQGAAFATAEAALERQEASAAAARFAELAAGEGGDAAALARLREAEARLAADDQGAALERIDNVVAAGDIDRILRDFAAVALAQHRLGEAATGDIEAMLERRTATDAPFQHTARELAALAALEAGDEATAIAELQELQADVTTPDAMRQRTDELLAALGVSDTDAGAVEETDEAS